MFKYFLVYKSQRHTFGQNITWRHLVMEETKQEIVVEQWRVLKFGELFFRKQLEKSRIGQVVAAFNQVDPFLSKMDLQFQTN